MTVPGEYLMSQQGTEPESAVLNHLSEVKRLLENLTFDTAAAERTRDTALLQCQALWRLIYYANGS